MIIMKFGGSSLANAERFRQVGIIITERLHQKPLLVLSAIDKTTDNLILAAHKALRGIVDVEPIYQQHVDIAADLNITNTGIEALFNELTDLLRGVSLVKELSARTLDHLISFGERLSTRLFSAYLNQQGICACQYDGWKAGFVTTSLYNRAEILPETYDNISTTLGALPEGTVAVVTGFIAKDSEGTITTLGRGGSDLTAAVIGAALMAREIQVWKDVHGILTTDPRILDKAQPVPQMSFQEAEELAYFGAKVLHPHSIQPAMRRNIPVRVKNSYDPAHPGTVITAETDAQPLTVTAITYKHSQVMVHISSTRMLGQHGFLASVFHIFADLGISVDVIATSEVSISMTLDNHHSLAQLEQRLGDIANVRIASGKSIISLIGATKGSSEILERSLNTLSEGDIRVQMVSHGASNVNTSLVVDDSDARRSIHLLHEQFFPTTE